MSLELNKLLYELDDKLPIAQAVDLVAQIKKMKGYDPKNKGKDETLSFIIYGGMMVIIGFLFKLKRDRKKIMSEIGQIQLQEPIEASLLKILLERWGQGLHHQNYQSIDILESQWDGINVIRNVFVVSPQSKQALSNQSPQKEHEFVSTNTEIFLASSQINQKTSKELKHQLEGKIFQTEIFIKESDLGSIFQPPCSNHVIHMKSILPISNIDLKQAAQPPQPLTLIYMLLTSVINFISLTVGSGQIMQGPTLSIGRADVLISPKMPLCIFGDLVYHNGITRFANIKWIGNQFESLKYHIIQHYDKKVQRIDRKFTLLVLLGIGLLTFKLLRGVRSSLLNDWMIAIEERYPRINEVKTQFKSVFIVKKEGKITLKCFQCNSNYIDFIFVPCYHFQVCQTCFNVNKQIKCQICQKEVYCGIPIYFG